MLARHHELIDGHVRLQHASFEGQRTAVLERAWRAGVTACICSSSQERDWRFLMEVDTQEPHLIPCFGLDPEGVCDRSPDWLAKLEHCLAHWPAGVGMLGLDRAVRRASVAEQEDVLTAQLRLAGKQQRPVLLRGGGQWTRLIALLEDLQTTWPGLLLFDFHGPPRLTERFVRLGSYFFVSGDMLTYRHARAVRLLRSLPLDRIIVGTDAPRGLPPAAHAPYQILDADRHPVNEPANLPHIVQGLAALLSLEPNALAPLLHHNALCLYGMLIPDDVQA